MESYIFFDTNIVFNDFHFQGFEFNKLLSLSEIDGYHLKITSLNVEEILKNYKSEASKVVKIFNGTRSDMKKYNLEEHLPSERISMRKVMEDYNEFLLGFLADNNIEIINVPSNSESLSNIFNKYFNNKKPFVANKNSFPDAILWETIIDFSETIDSYDTIYFISKNVKDFADKTKSKLHDDLQIEIPNCKYLSSLTDFFELTQISIDQSQVFNELESSLQDTIETTFKQYSETEFFDYLSSYLLDNQFQGDYFDGWGEDLHINETEILFSDILERNDNIVFISFSASVDSEFNITTINPTYERGYDDGTSEYIGEPVTGIFNLYGSFAYNTEEDVIEDIEIEI